MGLGFLIRTLNGHYQVHKLWLLYFKRKQVVLKFTRAFGPANNQLVPLLYGTWPFITFFKVMWFAVALWCKCCSCLSWLAGHFPTQKVVRHTWVSPMFSTRLCHHTIIHFTLLFPCDHITLSLLIKVLLCLSIIYDTSSVSPFKAFLPYGITDGGSWERFT